MGGVPVPRRQPAGEAGRRPRALRRASGDIRQWHLGQRLPGHLGPLGRHGRLPPAGLRNGSGGTQVGSLRSRHGAPVAGCRWLRRDGGVALGLPGLGTARLPARWRGGSRVLRSVPCDPRSGSGGGGAIPPWGSPAQPCRDPPHPPLQSSSPCGWWAAAPAATGTWRCSTTAPGAACAPTAPAPPRPAPSAGSWAAGTGAGWWPPLPRTPRPPGCPGWAARRGLAGSGGARRHPGTCRTAAPTGTPTSLVTRTAVARAGPPPHPQVVAAPTVPLAQAARPVAAAPPAPGWPGSPPHAAGDVPAGVPSSTTPAAASGTASVPTVLCAVLGTLLCLALGALAVQACRARAQRRGGCRWVGARAEPVWGSQGPG